MSLLKKPVVLAAGLAVAIAALYWFWPSAEPAAGAGQAAAGKAGAGQKPAGQRPGGPRPAGAGAAANPWAMPVPVRVIEAGSTDLKVQIKAIGTVTPLNTVLVQSRVAGPLQQVFFEEGQKVEAGQLLAQIDPADYKVELAQAQGQKEQNIALLKSAEQDLERFAKLKEQNTIAAQQMNAQQALVSQLKGAIKSNQAAIDAAALQLSYTQIKAPISGRLGLRAVDPGNLIQANSAEGLVTITQSSPIAVVFTIPETQLQQVRTAFRAGAALSVEAWDRAEQMPLTSGTLTTLDNQIDIATGTLKLKAEFANQNEELFPNQFVNVRLNVAVQSGAVTIPQDAVQYGAQGTYVYMVDDNNKAQIRQLKLGAVDNGLVAVEEGLKAGDKVVLEGLDRLRPDREVEVIQDVPKG
ncbi:efflux RND transporter periplasmic adaptor subunit [Rheinheimera sp. MM224]|uniref:efflux RND transporter periplasmic adaptor subunit n=1 Tax=Rheinheimera sp. MM224 TaxID=3019969 RepID=UPI0021F89F05|nr:efflux RND transporter periplasmic adaptor subunit [Rheinheimera sp. MM224]CAI3806693.1 Multidrug resistance protein MdtA [Rheinheimera sp. MM224]